MVLGFSQREKDIRESDRLFAELQQLPETPFDDARDEKKIALAARYLAAQYCGSPKAPEIGKQLRTMTKEDENARLKQSSVRDEIIKQMEQNSLPYRRNFYDKATNLANDVVRFAKKGQPEETKNWLTEQTTVRRKTNWGTIEEIQTHILETRSTVFDMRNRPLTEILAAIEEFNQWYGNLDLFEIEPTEIIETTTPLPAWAKN
jgi:hypothetical protein